MAKTLAQMLADFDDHVNKVREYAEDLMAEGESYYVAYQKAQEHFGRKS